MRKIQKFVDLIAWQEAHRLVLLIYHTSKNFPPDERFGLVNQIRRSGVSVTSNIAEGFGRKSAKDKQHFLVMAKTSLSEIQNHFIIAKDLSYINTEAYFQAEFQVELVHKLLGGLIKSVLSFDSKKA